MEDEMIESSQNGTFKYDREQLLSLRESPASKAEPKVHKKAPSYLFDLSSPPVVQPSMMPAFVRNHQANRNGTGRTNLKHDRKSELSNYLRPSTSEIISKDDTKLTKKSSTIHVSLSLNKDVKLNETKNAWRPSHLNTRDNSSAQSENLQEQEALLRRVRGILNKLTPENFDKLVEQILALPIDTFEKVNGVMKLVFEKAVDEPSFCVSYARLCKRLGDIKIKSKGENDPKLNFRTALLNKTELEFKNNVLNREGKETKLKPILQQLKECSDDEKRVELKLMFDEEDRKIRRRSGGTVCFIGELFKNSMLTGNIINCCILSLLDPTSEDKLECMCKLLTTVGDKFEKTINSKDSKKGLYNLDGIIKKIEIICRQKTQYKITSRIRFMLQDVIDLRLNKWVMSICKDSSPKTIEEIQKSVTKEFIPNNTMMPTVEKNLRRYNSTDNISGFSGRDNNTYSSSSSAHHRRSQQKSNDNSTWQTQVNRKNRSIDQNKLGSVFNQSATNFDSDTKLGNSSQFIWTKFTASNSIKQQQQQQQHQQQQQKQSPTLTSPVNSFAVLSSDNNKRNTNNKSPRKNNSVKKSFVEKSDNLRNNSRSNSPRIDVNLPKQTDHLDNESLTTLSTSMNNMSKSSSLTLPVIAVTDTMTSDDLVINQTLERTQSEEAYNPLKIDQNRVFLRALDNMIDACIDDKIEELPLIVNRFSEESRWGIFYNIFTEYLHLQKVTPFTRKILAKACIFLLKNNHLTIEKFQRAYKESCEIILDIIIDVPNMWMYIFQFSGPLIHKKIISITDLWNDRLKEFGQGKSFIKEFINYCTREIGPNYIRNLWRNLQLSWTDFLIDETDVDLFIQQNQFQFVENENVKPPLPTNYIPSVIMDRLKDILNDDDDLATLEEIPNYIDGNIATVDVDFIRIFTTTLCDFVIEKCNNNNENCKLDAKRFQTICMPLLHRYIENKEDLELACLYGVQQVDFVLEHPAGLLNELFSELYDAEIVSVESFIKWRDSSEEPRGKGVAVKSLNPFFNSIISCEVSDGSEY